MQVQKNTFIKFPSTGQFRDAIKQVQSTAKYHNVPVPKVRLQGTVKLHGTNAAVVINQKGEWWCQSRERIITPESDNAGFAAWVYGNKEYWDNVAIDLSGGILKDGECVQIYGEWCGGNIQKGVGLSYLPKMFVVFAIRFSEDAEGKEWHSTRSWESFFDERGRPDNIYFSHNFPTYSVEIDFDTPTLVQNQLVALTESVEKDCPVARQLLGPDEARELIGEGIFWSVSPEVNLDDNPDISQELYTTLCDLRFKVKGEKHSASKVKTIAPVDEEKVKSVQEFVDYACTENRLKQGLDKLTEMGLEHSVRSTGDYLRWVVGDILKEELSTMIASGIEPKDVNGAISKKAREFFMSNLE